MTIEELDWFPKKFAPGDIDGNTNEGLLGKTELSQLEILVRETAQNSWDARIPGKIPAYGISLRQPDSDLNQRLARLLPMGHSSEFAKTLNDPGLHVLEISDRNTIGLDGPVDMEPVADDIPKNFEDLIFKVGVPRHDGQGGGTFGFGKTAAFNYSGLGLVIYWTRCLTETGDPEHRLIASAFMNSYTADGVQFTGRHWWGEVRGDKILPVRGEPARRLGESLFETGFEGDQTGTSLLILAPRIENPEGLSKDPDGGAELAPPSESLSGLEPMNPECSDFAGKARSAIRRHLWPKLVPAAGESANPMEISLRVAGQDIDLEHPRSGALALWGRALNDLRKTPQDSAEPLTRVKDMVKTEVFPITRHGEILGHLAVLHRLLPLEDPIDFDDLDPADPVNGLGRVATMRCATELVVAAEDWGEDSPMPETDWLAVFRSTLEFDPVFAASEPPAHDSWVSSGSKPEVKLVVSAMKKMTTRKIAEALGLKGGNRGAGPGSNVKTGGLSRRLGEVLPSAPPKEQEEATRPSAPSRKAPARKWRVSSQECRFEGTSPDGAQIQRVDFGIDGPGSLGEVGLRVSIVGDQGVSDELDVMSLRPQWTQVEQIARGGSSSLLRPGVMASVRFRAPHRRALRIDLTVKEVS